MDKFLLVVCFFALMACESYNVDVSAEKEKATVSSDSTKVELPSTPTPTPSSSESPKVYQDMDGDGRSSKIDCNDSDPAVYPDAPELCDGIDNNCNGQTDEGCPVPTQESLLSLVVAFPNAATRTMSIEEYDDASHLFDSWKMVSKSSEAIIKAPIDSVKSKCGIRFSVTEGPNAWICMGNANPKLDPTATYFLEVKNFGVWIDVTDQVIPWPGEGTTGGCSALLVFTQEGECKLYK